MLIAHITDSHLEIPDVDEAGRMADFERVVEHIKQLEVKPELVIHTGDVSHCDRAPEYEFAKTALESIGSSFEVIPGNKDSRSGLAKTFDTSLPFAQKVVEAERWTLLLLDTLCETSNMGNYCEARLTWLKNALQNASKPVAIFMHHPSFVMTNNPYPFQFVEQQTADKFNDLVSKYSGVKGIFCGHAHRNTTGMVSQIPAMTLTAMSLDRRKGEYGAAFDGKPIYQLLELSDDGGFQTTLQACR